LNPLLAIFAPSGFTSECIRTRSGSGYLGCCSVFGLAASSARLAIHASYSGVPRRGGVSGGSPPIQCGMSAICPPAQDDSVTHARQRKAEQRIKPAGSIARNSYENDYSAWAPLQKFSTESRIAVLGLHHTNKGGADDPLEALSGSNGLSACADTTIVLDQDQNGRTLYVRGRDVEEKETAVIFAGGLWSVLGEASDVRRSDERSVIIEALTDNREPMTPSELAIALGKQPNNIKQLLFKMAKAGELNRVGKGKYWTDPVNPHNPDNHSNPVVGGLDD
jgi:hypothetical protein